MSAAVFLGLSVTIGVLALFLLGIWWLGLRESQRAAQRIRTDLVMAEAEAAAPHWWRLFSGPGRSVDAWFDDQGETERLLMQAGLRSATQRGGYFALQALLPLAVILLVAFGGLLDQLNGFAGFIYGFAAIIAGLLAPRWWLRARARARQARVRGEVALFIHLLALLFDAGLSLRQALSSMVREGQEVLPALGSEVKYVLLQLEAGAEPADALQAMGRNLDVGELSAVLGVLRQVDRYGGELREPLMEALALVEERRHLALREKVNAMSGRMTVVMVLFFFPALLIFVAGPAFLAVVQALGGGS